MKSLLTLTIFLFLIPGKFLGQSANYYVTAKQLNLRIEASESAASLKLLERYQNLQVVDSTSFSGWTKVKMGEQIGFVSSAYISAGKAVIQSYQTRIGATCRDGSRSRATGRGACSHHGGVEQWLYDEQEKVFIQKK